MLNTYISFATAPICIMNIREIVKDAVVLVLILFLLSVPAVILFFADGGQIIGLNYDPEKIPVPDGTVGVDGLTWEALDEPIEPIDDGTEIIQIELWQLPPRDILIRLVVSHMAYIPPSFSHLLSILYLSLGLGFFVLYRQKIKQKQRSQNSRREIIYQTILQNPGINLQRIIDKTGFSRGSVRYHLNALLNSQEISPAEFNGHARYFIRKNNMTLREQLFRISLSEKKSAAVIFCLGKNQRMRLSELADCAGVSISTMRWRIKRLEERRLVQQENAGLEAVYSLCEDVEEMLTAYLPEITEEVSLHTRFD